MAPKRRRSEVSSNRELEVKPTSRIDPLRRVTRSLTIKDGSSSSSRSSAPIQKQASKKKGKKPLKKTPEKSPKKTAKNDDDSDQKNAAAADDNKNAATETDEGGSSSSKITIIIEHCKQCQSFKRRANEAKAGLEKSVPGISVLINPDKPRRGCFEIRAEDGKAFVSLQDLKRPFKPMKDLDMDEVVADIVRDIGE